MTDPLPRFSTANERFLRAFRTAAELHAFAGATVCVVVCYGPSIGPIDFAHLDLFGTTYSRQQGLFWLLWIAVAITALVAKNIVRSRPGRAMQAIRDSRRAKWQSKVADALDGLVLRVPAKQF